VHLLLILAPTTAFGMSNALSKWSDSECLNKGTVISFVFSFHFAGLGPVRGRFRIK
jgi:hypothetical protein